MNNFEVTVEYFDDGISSLAFEYQKFNGVTNGNVKRSYNKTEILTKNAELDCLDFSDTKTWKKHTWIMENPALNNSMEGADLRIGIYSDTMGTSLGGEVRVSEIHIKDTGMQSALDIKVEENKKIAGTTFAPETIWCLSAALYPTIPQPQI